mgnify:CR=1 FL=1
MERLLRIVSDSHVKVVLHAKRAHLIKDSLNEDYPYYYLPEDKKYSDLNPELEVSYDELLADNHKYLWQAVSDYDKLQVGGLYIHSNAEPLGDFDPTYKPFVEQFAKNKIEFICIALLRPRRWKRTQRNNWWDSASYLVPVHTLHPELEENPFGERILPKRGQTATL